MARIDGYMYRSDDTISSLKNAYIIWTILSQSVTDATHTINVKLYVGNFSGTALTASSNQPYWIKYDDANIVSGVASWPTTPVGTDVLIAETNYIISHNKNGAAKIVTLSAYASIIPGTLVAYITVNGNITLPKISNGNIKISSLWKQAFCWRNILGTWKRCLIWRKINGTWKKGV